LQFRGTKRKECPTKPKKRSFSITNEQSIKDVRKKLSSFRQKDSSIAPIKWVILLHMALKVTPTSQKAIQKVWMGEG
jgi:hypothetical protein